MDIHNWIMDIHNSINDIHNSIMDIHNYMLAIMDIHNSIMDIHNSIMDIHNYRVYALLAFHDFQTRKKEVPAAYDMTTCDRKFHMTFWIFIIPMVVGA